MDKIRTTRIPGRLARGAFAAVALAIAAFAHASEGPLASSAAPAVERAEPKIQPAAPRAPAVAAKADLAAATRISLAAPSKALEAQASEPGPAGAPLQVGFARALDVTASPDQVAAALAWQALPGGGRVAAVTFTSPGAQALRAGIVVDSLPEGTTLRFYAPGSADVFAVGASQVRDTLERNRAAGDTSVAARTFWSPAVEGESLALEIELPPGGAVSDVRVSIPTLSHLIASPRDGFFKATSLSCEIDAMCHQDTWSVESNAVSRILFTDAGASYLCTGTLLADRDTTTFIPYFLTANHCVATQAVASTVQNYWFWRSTACDSGVPGPSKTTFGGGTLLYTAASTDTSFMRLNSAPPAGTAYAGWIASEPALGTSVTSLHHPGGDLLKISSGNLASYWNCSASGGGNFSCGGTTAAASTFMGVSWRSGTTEGGSSGSGLFTDNGRYLVGQLFGGNNASSCPATGTDFYGRFDIAYNAALSQWLGSTSAAGGATPAANYSDLWWNANESGWGLSLTQHGNALFAAWFVYDGSGASTWYVIPGGTWTSSTVFTGDIYAVSGPDPTASSFDPTRVVRTKVGSGTLRFSSSTQGSFTATVNGLSDSRAITRQPFGNGAAVTNAYGDLWWNANESGWGLSLHQQGDTLFAVWYTYAPDGSATWYVMPGGTWTAADTYAGTLYRTSYSGAFLGRSFNASGVARTPAGQLSLRFGDINNATMTYTVNGVSGQKQITKQPF